MKLFIAFALIATVASATIRPTPVGSLDPISIGPAIIDFPLPDGVVAPSPVVIGEIPAGAPTPLVQIIVNVNKPESEVAPAPVGNPVVDEVYVPGAVNVVDDVFPEHVVDPVIVIEPVVVEPIQIVSPIEAAPVQVVEPVVPSPVHVVEPVVVAPVHVAEPVVVAPVHVAEPAVIAPVVVGTPIIN